MAEITAPPILPEEFDTAEGHAPIDTGLVSQEPAMTSGTVASLTVLVTSVAIILKHAYGIEMGSEVINAVVDGVLVVINFVIPLVAAKFTRERVTPVR